MTIDEIFLDDGHVSVPVHRLGVGILGAFSYQYESCTRIYK